MSDDDVKLPPPHLGLAGVATDVDQRLANLALAFSSDETPEGQTALWLIRSLQIARRSLHGIEKTSHPVVILQLCREGLATAPE